MSHIHMLLALSLIILFLSLTQSEQNLFLIYWLKKNPTHWPGYDQFNPSLTTIIILYYQLCLMISLQAPTFK